MKLKSFFATTIAAFATSVSFADQGDVVVTFSTPGPDKYADGTQVLDKEWYALCWAEDGSFDGLKTDLTPVNPADEMLLAAPLAKGGKCPFTAFEFARNSKYTKGAFSIFLLDTRVNGVPSAKGKDGLPAFTRESSVAVTAAKGSADELTAKAEVAAGSVAWVQPELQDSLKATVDEPENGAKIRAFEILGANVQLTVENPLAATLVVKSGESIGTMNSYKVAPSTSETTGGETTIIIPKNNSKFFSVGTLAK